MPHWPVPHGPGRMGLTRVGGPRILSIGRFAGAIPNSQTTGRGVPVFVTFLFPEELS
jgi:hypothetical protein